MYKHVKEMWTAALRSGDFQQTHGMLKGEGGYCCLGVLSELYTAETGCSIDMYRGFPTSEVAEWAGVSPDVLTKPPALYQSFSIRLGDYEAHEWNDDEYKTFSEIADLIDQHITATDVQDIADPDNSREPAPISTEQLAGYLTPAEQLV